jgi:16S rRNA (guanine527-N7)-methyltransferase
MGLSDYLQKEELALPLESIEKLERFTLLLEEWNGVHNLTGAKSKEQIYANIVDSLYPLNFIKRPKRLLDVGTGAGFPGLVLAIVLEDAQVVLSEPLKKRVSFLKYVKIDLGLTNLRVESTRVEHLPSELFDLISSRAVTNTELLLALTRHLSEETTRYLFYKGSRIFDEMEMFDHQLKYDIVQKNQRNYLYIKGFTI